LIFRNAKRGLNLYNAPKFYVASIYWHFIDVVWVFIFTVVYLMGMVG
ncbi:cytochrome c oxidase subunit 3, partial [Acinetobacter baumannii]